MYGIRSTTAKFILPATLALAIAAFASPVQADRKYHGGHGVYGGYAKYGNPGYHRGKKFKKRYKRAYRKGYRQGYRQGYRSGARYGHRYAPKYGKKFYYKPRYKSGYAPKHGKKFYYKPRHKSGYAPNRKYWRKYGRHGVTVQAWKHVAPPRPAYKPYRAKGACHPVVGHGSDHFGRRGKFGGTMCYDRHGQGYVVAGSRHVIRYY